MNSSKDILDMIATEVVEGDFRRPNIPERRPPSKKTKAIRYDLRLVKHKDGTLEWKD